MTLVRSLEELEGNVRQLSAYLNSPIEIERSFAVDLVKKGICFVAIANADSRSRTFYPSRFIGYAGNNLRGHSRRQKDGRDTNVALAELLGSEPTENRALEVQYRDYCRSLGFQPNQSGPFGVKRKFWLFRGIVFAG